MILLIIAGILVAFLAVSLWAKGGVNRYRPDLTGKFALVVGGTAGIGKEAARDLAKMGATVVITGRDSQKAKTVIDDLNQEEKDQGGKVVPVEFIKNDISDLDAVKELSDLINRKWDHLDLLVNNAGITSMNLVRTKQGIESTMGVNYVALFYLSSLLLPLVRKAKEGRIVNVSSRGHKKAHDAYPRLPNGELDKEDFLLDTITKENYTRIFAYRLSKLGQVYFTKRLASMLEKAGINNVKTISLHPGVVRTEIWQRDIPLLWHIAIYVLYPFLWVSLKTEKEGAQTTLYGCCCPFDKLFNGAYYSDCAVEPFKPIAKDDAVEARCWKLAYDRILEKTGHRCFDRL